MLDTLDRLQPAHLAILAAVASDPEPPGGPRSYLLPGSPSNVLLRRALPAVSEEIVDRCWEDLAALRLIDSASILTDTEDVDSERRITYSALRPFGRRFLDFVTRLE